MNTVTFNCQVITPMFSGNASQKAEFRPSEIKAAMRFWWRAMQPYSLLEELKKEEVKIFGGSYKDNGNEKSLRSSFDLQIVPTKVNIKDNLANEIRCIERTSRSGNKYYEILAQDKGVAYLLYSTFMMNRREYIAVDSEFDIILESNNHTSLGKIIPSLMAMFLFGGIGTRSRRGGGNIKLLSFKSSLIDSEIEKKLDYLSKIKECNDIESLCKFLKSKIFVTSTGMPSYSHLGGSSVYLFNPLDTWKGALNILGKYYLEFRTPIRGSRMTETPEFGFPINHNRPRTTMQGGEDRFNRQARHIGEKLERRASPFIFKVIGGYDSHGRSIFFPVIIQLNGTLLPNGYKIMDRFGGNVATPTGNIYSDFINTIPASEYKLITL